MDVSRKDYRAVAQTLKELRSTSPIPQGWDEIIEKLEPQISSSEVFTVLFELELNGKIKQMPGKNFVKSF